ncbi:sucrose-6-phosphate hydrolase [Staphylococcus sp. 11261D007BR]
MEQWSRDQRYRKLEDIDDQTYEALKQKVAQSSFRQRFHIQPITGLLNDPNGLIYFNGQYHLSHQWFPLGAVHGLKYWDHYKATNLTNFKREGIIMKPDTSYDSHGVYSGSAFVFNDTLYYMYTANHRTAQWQRESRQMIAKVDEKGEVHKITPPAIEAPPEGYTQHFRDPKVFQKDHKLYAIIGAQREDMTGCALLYEADHPETQWTFLGEIQTDLTNFGYMWECPDYFNINGYDFLMFSPQGVEATNTAFRNQYQSGYIMGKLDFDTLVFEHGPFQELDHGFDFYAPQTFEDEVGRRVLIGWMGLPDTQYPTDDEGWAHCLTLPRTLVVEHGRLKQKPHMHLRKLRGEKETALGYADKFVKQLNPYEGKQYELIIDILDNEASAIEFQLRASKMEHTTIRCNSRTREVTLERFDSGQLPYPVEGTDRVATLNEDLYQLRIFVDTSSIEIFCNEGDKVLTSRIFPSDNSNKIKVSTETGQVYLKMSKYDIQTEASQEDNEI